MFSSALVLAAGDADHADVLGRHGPSWKEGEMPNGNPF